MQVLWGGGDAKDCTGVGALEVQAQLLRGPHDLAHIERADAAPQVDGVRHGQASRCSAMAAASAATPLRISSTSGVTNDRRMVRGSAWSL